MSKPHWKVVTTKQDWPAIQAEGHDAPLLAFQDETPIGARAAVRWANFVCAWMNEQMRLGDAANKPRPCDPMLLVRLRKAKAELTKLNLENQDIHKRLLKAQDANRRAAEALSRVK